MLSLTYLLLVLAITFYLGAIIFESKPSILLFMLGGILMGAKFLQHEILVGLMYVVLNTSLGLVLFYVGDVDG